MRTDASRRVSGLVTDLRGRERMSDGGAQRRRRTNIRRLGVRIPSGALVETATKKASDLRKRGTEAVLVLGPEPSRHLSR